MSIFRLMELCELSILTHTYSEEVQIPRLDEIVLLTLVITKSYYIYIAKWDLHHTWNYVCLENGFIILLHSCGNVPICIRLNSYHQTTCLPWSITSGIHHNTRFLVHSHCYFFDPASWNLTYVQPLSAQQTSVGLWFVMSN